MPARTERAIRLPHDDRAVRRRRVDDVHEHRPVAAGLSTRRERQPGRRVADAGSTGNHIGIRVDRDLLPRGADGELTHGRQRQRPPVARVDEGETGRVERGLGHDREQVTGIPRVVRRRQRRRPVDRLTDPVGTTGRCRDLDGLDEGPERAQRRLRVERRALVSDDEIVLGQHEAELPGGAVEAESVPPAPHLVAVAEAPVVHFALTGGRPVEGGRRRPRTAHLLDVPGRRDLPALPHAARAEHGGGAGEVVDGEVVAGCPVLDAADRAHPPLADAERVEQPRSQVGGERLARDGRHDRRQRVRRRRVVREEGPRLVRGRDAEEVPRVVADRVDLRRVVSCVHRQEVPHRDAVRVGLAEQVAGGVVETDPPLVGEEADRERRIGLGCRVDERRAVERVRRPRRLEHHVAGACDEECMRVEALVLQARGEGEEGGRRDADLFGRAADERSRGRGGHDFHPMSGLRTARPGGAGCHDEVMTSTTPHDIPWSAGAWTHAPVAVDDSAVRFSRRPPREGLAVRFHAWRVTAADASIH